MVNTMRLAVLSMFAVFGMAANAGDLKPRANEGLTITDCGPAPADGLANLCARFTTQNGIASCFAEGNGRYFNSCGLDLCHRFTTENGALECIRTVRNKDYTRAEMDVCNRSTTETAAISCAAAAGTPHQGGGNPDMQLIKERIRSAIEYIDQDRAAWAKLELYELIDYIDGR